MSAGREGKSKGEFSREGKSFRLLVEGTGGEEEWLKDFQAVVDCTGTYGQGRWGFSPFNVLDYFIQLPDGWEREGFLPLERESLLKRWISVLLYQGKLLNYRWSTGYQMF